MSFNVLLVKLVPALRHQPLDEGAEGEGRHFSLGVSHGQCVWCDSVDSHVVTAAKSAVPPAINRDEKAQRVESI